MEEDAYGIPKPKDTEVIVPTLLFVPCVGYGAGGFRLGYGGGFYDRTLATLQPRPYTVGLGFTNGFLEDFEPEPHDVPLDAILNDNGVVWPIALRACNAGPQSHGRRRVSGSGTSPMLWRVVALLCAISHSQKALISGRCALRGPTISQ